MIIIFKVIEACRANQPLQVVSTKANAQMSRKNDTNLIQIQNRFIDPLTMIIVASIGGAATIIMGIATAVMDHFKAKKCFEAWTNRSITYNQFLCETHPGLGKYPPGTPKEDQGPDRQGMEQYGVVRRISMPECLNESSACPDYLKNIAAAALACSQIKDDDLTYKLMRVNLDLAILRETLASSPIKKENNTSSKAGNSTIV